MRISRVTTALAAAILLLAGCAKGPASISISPASLTLTEGDTGALEAKVLPEDAKYGAIKWTSSDESVATVNGGRVTAVSAGSVTITASTEGVSGTASVKVNARYVPVETVKVTDPTGASAGSFNVGQTVQLKAEVLPANATEKAVTWSATTDCASVDANGLVTIQSLGDCVIRATTKDGRFGEYAISISIIWAESLKVVDQEGKSEGEVARGNTLQLKAVITPANASFPEVQWSVQGIVATIDQTGLVTPLQVGTTVVTAKIQGTTAHPVTATYNLTVKPAAITGVEISPSTLVITEGKEHQFTAKALPEGAGDPGFLWSSSNTTVATISSSGLMTARNPGKTLIYVYTADGSGKSASCEVTVEQDKTLKGIKLSSEEMNLKTGEAKTLEVFYTPSYAANKNVSWTSSDESVATVNAGIVTAVDTGTATITATSEEGGYKATCKVNVSASLPAGIKVFYLDYTSSTYNLYMNGEKILDNVHNYTVAGDDIYSIRINYGIYRNGKKMDHDKLEYVHGEALDFDDMTVVGDKLYMLVSSGKYSYARVAIMDINTGKIEIKDFAPDTPYSSYGYQDLFMDVAPDGTIYIAGTFMDEYKQVSSRQWKISPSWKVEQTIFMTQSKNLDSTGANLGDAFETYVSGIDIDGSDIYTLVYRETYAQWKANDEFVLYKNGKPLRTYGDVWRNGGYHLDVTNGNIFVSHLTHSDNKQTIWKNDQKLYTGMEGGISSMQGSSNGDIYYILREDSGQSRVMKNSTALYSSSRFASHLVITE